LKGYQLLVIIKVCSVKDDIEAKATSIDKEIDVYYEKLEQQMLLQLQQQKHDLKTELHGEMERRKKKASIDLEMMEHCQAELESIEELNGAVKRGSDQEALLMEKQVMDNVKRLSQLFDKLSSEPVGAVAIEFECVKGVNISLPQLGNLNFGPTISVVNSKAVNVPKMASKGDIVNFSIVTKDHQNYVCHKDGSDITSQVESSRGEVIPVEMKDNKDGSYSATFVAKHMGELRLSVTINKQNIKGSPYLVNVHRNYCSLDKPSNVIGMKLPRGIVFAKDGVWAVGTRITIVCGCLIVKTN